MSQIKSNMFEALKARADKARVPMTEEEKEALRERIRNSKFFKKLKEAKEKKLNALNKKEE